MKTFVFLAALLPLAACQADSKNLSDRMDRIEKKLDALVAQSPRGGTAPGGPAAPRAPRPEPNAANTYAVPIDNDPFDGPADAKVTIVKAYDYACPFCEQVRTTMTDLRKRYGNDVRIVYKQLVVHPDRAMASAVAFCAAAKQGKAVAFDNAIWEKSYKARTFDPDKCWETDAGCPTMTGIAQDLGLDLNKLKADMKGCVATVQADKRDLLRFGVGATPSFFINGRFLSGAMPTESFVPLIDEELQKANERIQQGTPAAQYYQQWVLDKGLKSLVPPKQ